MFARSLPAHSMGGMELHIETLSKELVKNGIKVTIITTLNPLGIEYENMSGVKIHYLKGTVPGKYQWGYYKQSAAMFMELHKKEKFDLIHSQSAGAYQILKNRINTQLNIPVIISLHGTSIDEIKTKLRLGFDLRSMLSLIKNLCNYIFLDRRFLQMCDTIIATSDSQVNTIAKYYGIAMNKLRLVYNGIDDELFVPNSLTDVMTQKLNIKPDDKVIVAVARLKKEKGIQNIISVLPMIKEKVPSVKLIVGGTGEYRKMLEKMAVRLGVSDRVVFLGRIEYKDLPDILNCSKIFVNSTIRENGYDLTIPQSMACGKPVVSSNVRSVFTVIENGKNGYIYERSNMNELKSIIIKLLLNETLQNEIGLLARKTVEDKLSLRSMAKNTIDVYKSVLEKRK